MLESCGFGPGGRIMRALVVAGMYVLALACSSGERAQSTQTITTAGALRTEVPDRAPMDVPFWFSERWLRMDLTVPLEMSIVWAFGTSPSMRMIEHDQRRYVEWGPRQFEGARGLMESSRINAHDIDAADWRFEETGRTDTIEEWAAYEVRVTGLPGEGESHLWLSEDVGSGLVEFFGKFAAALEGTTQFPMTGGDNDVLGLSAGTNLPLSHFGQVTGLPAGRVVRIADRATTDVSVDACTIITLLSVVSGSAADDPFKVPAGYEQTAMLGDETP